MTTTNNNREYAIRLYYEVREADNSINCKNAYKVFDNMQDAVNYAIDFIANNPDANICLTNEHFNGSQISVYGNGSTKHYDLTDADINAVRNAVNAKADEITLDDILNDDEVSEHFQPVTVYAENQYGREVLVADGKVITEEEYYAMCIENCFNELRSMIKFYYKHHGLTLAQTEQIFMAIYIDEGNLAHDAIEQMIRDFKAANNPDDEPPTPPTPPTDRREEISAEMSSIAVEIADIYDELDAINAEDAEDGTPQSHIDYLNDHINTLRARYDNLWRELDDDKPTPPPAVDDNFEREYAQAAEATARIRQIDPDAEILFAVDESPAERFILTTSDNSIALCATADEAENYFHTLQADKSAPHVNRDDFNEHINHTLDGRVECRRHFDREEMWLTNGRWFHILSDKYDADIFRRDDGSISYGVTFDGDFISQNVPEDEFFAVMARRGACTIDTPSPADIINNLNAHAPEGWSVVLDAGGKKFFVKHGGQSVAELDSLALAKSLPPDKFFDRFALTDDNQHYADQLSRERQALIDMRDELSDPARIKIIDGLIKDIEREILTARLDLPSSAG